MNLKFNFCEKTIEKLEMLILVDKFPSENARMQRRKIGIMNAR